LTIELLTNNANNLRKQTEKDLFILNLKSGLVRAMKGLDYYRVIEYAISYLLLNLKKGDRVLDIGSLDSIFPIYLSVKGYEIYAIDINIKVGGLKKLARTFGLNNFCSLVSDATKMPFPNNFFDKITAISSVEHILPVEIGDFKAFREIARVLKVGGNAIITVPYKNEVSQKWRYHPTHGRYLIRWYNKKYLTRIAKTAGLSSEILFFCDDVGFARIWYNFLEIFLSPISIFFGHVFLRLRTIPFQAKGAIIVLRKDKVFDYHEKG